MDLKFHMPVDGHICCPVNLFFCSRLHLSKLFGKCASGTGCLNLDFLQLMLLPMLESLIEKIVFNKCHLMHCVYRLLICPLPMSIGLLHCRLSGSFQMHLKFPYFCCSNLCSPIHLNLHCSMDFINLLFLQLMEFSCLLFIHFGLCRLCHFLISTSTHSNVELLKCMV